MTTPSLFSTYRLASASALLLFFITGCDDKDDPVDSGEIIVDDGDVDNDGDGFSTADGDCNDEDSALNPTAEEICDGIDNNCDGNIDEGVTNTFYADNDSDGFGDDEESTEACETPSGYAAVGGDCDDTMADSYPGGIEVCDGADNDCDGQIDEDAQGTQTWYADADGDGFGDLSLSTESCTQPSNYVSDYTDCNDSNGAINPDAIEVCDGEDNNCNGLVDTDALDLLTWYRDNDSDSFGDASASIESCDQPGGYVSDDTDCDDTDSAINPSAIEICDGVDNDCDGDADTDAIDQSTFYADDDGDGYGDASTSTDACDQPSDYVSDDTDCDDADSAINPSATEVCDGVDNDCSGSVDDNAVDASTWYADDDGDTYGDPYSSTDACDQPSGYVTDRTDCDDTESTTNPTADEYCDNVDNDCDGTTDEDDAVDAQYLADDSDGDGFGDPGTTDLQCDGVDNEYDCNDVDSNEPQVVDAAYGSPTGDGSLNSPYDAIQDGIDNANECVVVYSGTYTENIDFGGKGVMVTGVEGADDTIINGGDAGPAVTFSSGEGADSELSSFTLTEGYGYEETTSVEVTDDSDSTGETTYFEYYTTYCGGGIFVDGAEPTLSDLTITENDLSTPANRTDGDGNEYYYYSYGGGICVRSADLYLSDVDLLENYAEDGGGMFVDSSSGVELVRGWVLDNSAVGGGGFEVDGGSLTLVNVVSAWNTATSEGGGILMIDGTLDETNVTHSGDDAPSGGAIYLAGETGASTGTITNTIIYGSGTGEGILADAGVTFSGTYNNVYGNTGGEYSGVTDPTGSNGNISSDPLFSSVSDDGDYTNDDWTLSSSSPSIDAGDPASSFDDADGTTNDQGAFGGPDSTWN